VGLIGGRRNDCNENEVRIAFSTGNAVDLPTGWFMIGLPPKQAV
jgi:hypothetical protein